jgi:uncharacterized protein YdcH (DUF465 family)
VENTAIEELRAHLMATNEEFRRLAAQHAEYSKRVDEIKNMHAPSDQDQIEEVRLKKLKLHLKDRMAEMISRAAQDRQRVA